MCTVVVLKEYYTIVRKEFSVEHVSPQLYSAVVNWICWENFHDVSDRNRFFRDKYFGGYVCVFDHIMYAINNITGFFLYGIDKCEGSNECLLMFGCLSFNNFSLVMSCVYRT